MFRLPKKIVEVYLPRLSIQIMHEWTTPSDKKIVEISDDDNKRIKKMNFTSKYDKNILF